MKTKITTYTLIIAFILSAVHCNVEASDTNSSAGCCSTNTHFYEYTEQEQQQVRQNLLGTYQGIHNNEIVTINIINQVNLNYINSNTDYSIYFVQNRPMLSFIESDNVHLYYIRFGSNSQTNVIALHSALSNSVEYLIKIPNEDPPQHDEL